MYRLDWPGIHSVNWGDLELAAIPLPLLRSAESKCMDLA